MDNFLEEFKKLKEKVEVLEKRTLSSLKLDSLTTGIIKPSSDSTSAIKITKADGTTNILNIDSTNVKVGIGTEPNYEIHIKKIIDDVNIGVENDSRRWLIGVKDFGTGADYFRIRDNTGNSERLIIDTSGKVSINSATPNGRLKVYSDSADIGSTGVGGIVIQSNGTWVAQAMFSGTNTKTLVIHYGRDGSNVNDLRFGRYGSNFGSWEANPIRFSIDAPDNSLVLTSSGRLGIRNSNPQAALHSIGDSQTGNIIATNSNAYKSDWPGGWGGGLGTWDISCSGIYYSVLTQRSDKRLKKNIKKLKIDNLIEKINYLKPVSFKWKSKDKGKDINYGFIAQEFIKIFPDLIRKDNNNYLSIDYIGIIPILVKAIQELSLKVEKLEKNEKSNKRRA
jgi:hypothetical protein